MTMQHRTKTVLTLAAVTMATLVFTTTSANAATVNVVNYRLGEADAGAAAGGAGNATTVEGIAGLNAAKVGGPVYSGDTGVGYSSLSMDFDGSDDYYQYSGAVGSAPVDNFAFEAWIKPASFGTGAYVAFYGGNPAPGGYGLYVNSAGKVGGFVSGVTGLGFTNTTSLDTWAHVAFVRDSGTSTIYLDGVADAATTGSGKASLFPAFTIGATTGGGGNYFNGLIDEVKLFTFDAGTFNVSMLNQGPPVPEPSTMVLLCVGLLGLIGVRRRQR